MPDQPMNLTRGSKTVAYTPEKTHQAERAMALRLRAEVERLRGDYSRAAKYHNEYRDEAHDASEALLDMIGRLEAAEAESAHLASVVAKVEALHGGTHWCFDGDGQDVVFERGTEWWPCPTFAALASVGVSGPADDRREANASQAPDTATPGEAKKRHLHSCSPSDCDHIANRCCIDCCEPGGWAEPAASSADDKAGAR